MSHIETSKDSFLKLKKRNDPQLDQVDQFIHSLIESCASNPLQSILLYHFSSKGKKLRALLATECTDIFNGQLDDAIIWAGACEILHNATLIHDDLQDGDKYRRGQPSTWLKYGKNQAINAGDFLLMLSQNTLTKLSVVDGIKWQLSKHVSEYSMKVCLGQSLELDLIQQNNLWQAYITCIQNKTGAFFELPVFGAALISGLSVEKGKFFANAIAPLGLIFQLQDDIIDLYGNKGREIKGCDLREGKISSLVVKYLQLKPENSERTLKILNKERLHTQDNEVKWLTEEFSHSGALKAVLDEIYKLETQLVENLNMIEHLPFKSMILAVLDQVLNPLEGLERV